MVGIQGIGNGPVRANDTQQAGARGKRDAAPAARLRDDVAISNGALEASQIARATSQANADEQEVRSERVAEAKRNVEEGMHRIQTVVEIVAARISPYISI